MNKKKNLTKNHKEKKTIAGPGSAARAAGSARVRACLRSPLPPPPLGRASFPASGGSLSPEPAKVRGGGGGRGCEWSGGAWSGPVRSDLAWWSWPLSGPSGERDGQLPACSLAGAREEAGSGCEGRPRPRLTGCHAVSGAGGCPGWGLARCKGTSFQVTLVLSQAAFVPKGLASSVRPGCCCWVITACARVVLLLQDAAVTGNCVSQKNLAPRQVLRFSSSPVRRKLLCATKLCDALCAA